MGKKRKKAVLESSDEHIESIEEHVPKKVRKNKIKDKEVTILYGFFFLTLMDSFYYCGDWLYLVEIFLDKMWIS